MLKSSNNRFYLVPVVLRTLDILELLANSDQRLRIVDIANGTKASHSTTFRIVRTLVQRGYLWQDLDGRFGILNTPGKGSLFQVRKQVNDLHNSQSRITGLSGTEVIELLYRVLEQLCLSGERIQN